MTHRLKRLFSRPHLTVTLVAVLTALFIVLIDNHLFWHSLSVRLGLNSANDWFFALTVGAIITLVLNALFNIVFLKPLFKPFLIFVLLTAAMVSYFMDSFGVIVDKSMIHNVLETDVKEASELLTWPLFSHLLLYGGLPVTLLLLTRVKYHPWRRELLARGGLITGSLALIAVLVLVQYKNFTLFGRENRDLRMFINPVYATYSLNKVVQKKYFTSTDKPIQAIAPDATRPDNGPRSVVVLVVGETARAQSFSLNGYERDTNPYLAGQPILNFSNVQSCGTSTAESLPCMFSLLEHSTFKREKAAAYENVLDVLQRAGVEVVWRDNDSGSKGLSDRVTYQDFNQADDQEFCTSGNCFDEILLKGLPEIMNAQNKDMLIVLHIKGSHGPAYYKRVPPSFKIFSPECASGNIQDCSQQEIINAYDTTILYTDYVLSRLIKILEQQSFATAMLYISDHGESLGENGIYLHGLPYAFAPPEQTRVPMIFWASEQFAGTRLPDLATVATRTGNPYSHDNLFHSLLGLFDVSTRDYRPELDLFLTNQPVQNRSMAESNPLSPRPLP